MRKNIKLITIILLSLIIIFNSYNITLADEPSERDFLFAEKYTVEDIMDNPQRAEEFVMEYLRWESNFFAIARDEKTALVYDGYNLDKNTGLPLEERYWSAPSKECLDLAICIKAILGHPYAATVVSKDNPEKSEEIVISILEKKLESYQKFYETYPGYGGFMPWYYIKEEVTPTDNWFGRVPGLDNGEWVWTLLIAEKALREKGYIELADKYALYIDMLRENAVKIFYDEKDGKVRAETVIHSPYSQDSEYSTCIYNGTGSYLSGEHGVHEGVMMDMFVILFGKGLPEDGKDRVWDGIKMVRVEHKYGTTWQGYWGSAHESWAYMFLPYRDISGYRDLFRIREIIRSQNAVEMGYPGFATSALQPGEDGYLDGAGIEDVGSQEIRNNHIFVIYGVFPMLLEFSGKEKPLDGNYGLAWLLNMLKGKKMQGPLGSGEAGTNDGKNIAHSKTVDGSFTNIIALFGGLEKESASMLKDYGLYDEFIEIMEKEYDETFGEEPLKEPCGFALPSVSVPVDTLNDYSY